MRSSFHYDPDGTSAMKKRIIEKGVPIIWIYVGLDITLDYMITTLMASKSTDDYRAIEKTVIDSSGRILVSTRQKKLKADSGSEDDAVGLIPYPYEDIRKAILAKKEGEIVKRISGSGKPVSGLTAS